MPICISCLPKCTEWGMTPWPNMVTYADQQLLLADPTLACTQITCHTMYPKGIYMCRKGAWLTSESVRPQAVMLTGCIGRSSGSTAASLSFSRIDSPLWALPTTCMHEDE